VQQKPCAAINHASFQIPSLENLMANTSIFEKFIAANETAVDTSYSVLSTSLNSFEKLTSLAISHSRKTLSEQIDSSKKLLGTKDLQDALSVQSSLVQPQIDNLIALGRDLYEISSSNQEELIKLLEKGHSDVSNVISSALDWYGKSAHNSEAAVAAAKSAIAAANSAFENTNKAVRQVANLTDATINAATTANFRAASAANQSRKKAA
jgi:phasin family protein